MKIEFNHEEKNIHRSIGLTDDRADEITAGVLFEMINQSYLVDKLFSNPEEAPVNLRTKTGVMERSLEDVNYNNEMVYAIWEYTKYDMMTSSENKHHEKMKMAMSMLFMMSDMKKEKFIRNFINKKRTAEASGDLD